MTALLAPQHAALKRTPLHDLHVALGAQMGAIRGLRNAHPVSPGIMKEHLHTRALQVSSTSRTWVRSHCGRVTEVWRMSHWRSSAWSRSMCWASRQAGSVTRFSRTPNGGVIDDLMIAHCGDHFVLVVNASRKVIDEAHLRAAMSRVCTIEVLEDRALLALQGPEAERVLGSSRTGQRNHALHGCSFARRSPAAPAS